MRKIVTIFGICAALSGGVMSAESEMDSDLMQSIEDTAKSVTANIDLKDPKGTQADARELEQLFAQVEAFYARKNDAHDAQAWSKSSREWAAIVARFAADKDFDSAAKVARDITRTCKTCHNTYKS